MGSGDIPVHRGRGSLFSPDWLFGGFGGIDGRIKNQA